MQEHDSRSVPSLAIGGANEPLTMTSQEIADLLEKRHDKVKQSIERLAERGAIQLPPVGKVKNHLGQAVEVFRLEKRDTYVVVAQLSPEFTARLVDRWQELEERVANPAAVLNDPTSLRKLLLDNVEKVIALEAKVEEMREDVEAFEHLTDATGTFSRTEAAKNLGIQPSILIRWMKTNGWTYRRIGAKEDLAYQSKIAAGILEHKVITGSRPDGSEWASTQVRVTAKGLTVLAKAFPRAVRAA